MSLLNLGTRALQVNQVALQTTGNNIANVNTVGYSRQKAVLEAVEGQYSGSGYVGRGVNVQTIQRNFDEFLVRQSALASSNEFSDKTRADYLKQLEGIFEGGKQGLGASISDMMNAFSDVSNAPTDLTARTVALTRVQETASRMRSTSQRLDDLQLVVQQSLDQKISSINSIAKNIAAVNDQVIRALGSGQPPNDLLDQRDQLIRDLNQFVQTTQINADDGSIGIYLSSSQELILGTRASSVAIVKDDFGDPRTSTLAIIRNGEANRLDDHMLGGGEVSGLIRFQNHDLNEGRNLLGRLTMAISTAMNAQHKLGTDLDGNIGGDIFSPTVFGGANVLQPAPPAFVNKGTTSLTMGISDVTKFAASDYFLSFSGPTAGTITRNSDGQQTAFDFALTSPVVIDGLSLTQAGLSSAGDRFLLKPFTTSASNISSQFSSPRALAVASPVAGTMGASNKGSLQQMSLAARSNPPVNVPVTLTFTGPNTYTRSDDVVNVYNYTPGEAIEATLPDLPLTSPPTYSLSLIDWSVKIQGTPGIGDSYTVNANAFPALSAGNALAILDLRDVAMFDGAALTDGFAGVISQVGIRSQSANYAAQVSQSIATTLEHSRTGVSGVNLDEEASKLLQYQQAYQACAKMIQIANSIFDTLLNSLAR
jgi:flagellar hook-associated protein 1 FlgK